MLKAEVFSAVVKNTPLISIDLIVRNKEGSVLLGKRVNEPVRGFWFVPGGRIFKNKTLDSAFKRDSSGRNRFGLLQQGASKVLWSI